MFLPASVFFLLLSVAQSDFVSSTRKFSFAASVRSKTDGHLCIGAILSASWVISPASCLVLTSVDGIITFRPHDTLIVAAKTTKRNDPKKSICVDTVQVHPSFSMGIPNHDLALLWLDKKLYWFWQTTVIPKIAPLTLGAAKAPPQEFNVVGWAISANSRLGENTLLSYHSFMSTVATPECDNVGFVCALAEKPNEFCYLDQGSLLVNKKDNSLVGIMSMSPRHNECSSGLEKFLVLAPFIEWIQETTEVVIKRVIK